jgi:hypothetical protein
MWKASRPEGGGVDSLGQQPKADLALLELGDRLREVLERPAKPVEAPDDECVLSVAQVFEASLELGTLAQGSGGGVGEGLLAAGLFEGVVLHREVLLSGGDPCVADECHQTAAIVSEPADAALG